MNPKKLITAALLLAFSLLPFGVQAQGTLPITLQQQFSFSGCSTTGQACGTPLIGGLLYFYQVGTVATPQNSFQDTALTIPNPFPLILDSNGRVPPFYLANGSVHVRLTDSGGVVQFDYANMLVIGPSSGGGGGGSSVDPTTVLSTGDIKFRATGESVAGWVKLNGQTIGSAVSGASGRANADTQALFIYWWTNCPDAHCAVVGGRGANGLADFTANKQITLPDWRARAPVGLDDMGNSPAGRLLASNVTSGGGDGVTTPNATGGEANHLLAASEVPAHTHGVFFFDPGHNHTVTAGSGGSSAASGSAIINPPGLITTSTNTTGARITDTAGGIGNVNATSGIGGALPPGGGTHNTMSPFMLGTWLVKL